LSKLTRAFIIFMAYIVSVFLDLRNCDHLCHSGSQFTYCNEVLGSDSVIDHFLLLPIFLIYVAA